jgi:RNA polymerase sigma-70 factor (ECF subfamily)
MNAGGRGRARPPATTRLEVRLEVRAPTREDAPASIGLSIRATVAWVPRVERELVERAQHGDEEAFDLLVGRTGDQLFGLAYHILRDPQAAEDAVQQALVDIWQQLPRLRDPASFTAWSHKIVVRAAYAESSRRRRWVVMPAREPGPSAIARDPAGGIADRDQLDRGFRRLSIDHRVVVALKYFADRSDDQIADILDIPVGTVRSRLFASMRQLRAELDADARGVRAPGDR